MADLDAYADLAAARTAALAAARDGGLSVALAMLSESLSQLEAIAPAVSAEVWEGYAAVLATAPGRSPATPQGDSAAAPVHDIAPVNTKAVTASHANKTSAP